MKSLGSRAGSLNGLLKREHRLNSRSGVSDIRIRIDNIRQSRRSLRSGRESEGKQRDKLKLQIRRIQSPATSVTLQASGATRLRVALNRHLGHITSPFFLPLRYPFSASISSKYKYNVKYR